MKVLNIHERELEADYEQVAKLIDSLSSEDDLLWPNQCWPRMKFDRPLSVGAKGGHGPVGYVVEAYKPGESIKFRFTSPKGFNGLVTFKSVYMVSNLIKTRSLSMVKVHQQKPGERDRDGTRNTYNTSISSCNR